MDNYNVKPTDVDIHYKILEDGERLYDDVTFYGTTKIVKAEYVHNNQFPGNALVEAIPAPRTPTEIYLECQKEMEFDYEKMIRSPLSRQIGHLISLRGINYVMPFQPMLENAFHMALINSYSHRTFLESKSDKISVYVEDREIKTSRILLGNAADGAFGGFCLIGNSGSGKTTSLKLLFFGYPQVIVHPHKDGSTSVQILYIVVNCPARSNFRALLQAIGRAIDLALGNIEPKYEKMLTTKPRDNLGVAFLTLRRIIESLSIGMIILDEFQNMNLDPSMENSMNSLLFIGNDTKCVFGVLGTKYSKDRLFDLLSDSLKSQRRLGVEIPADNYCKDREFVYRVIRWLFRYQLFDPRVRLKKEDDPICEALYDCSQGIIDQIVSVFTFMNLDFIMKKGSDKEPEITPEYVKEIAEKYFPSIQKILHSKKKQELTPEQEEELAKQRQELSEELFRMKAEKEQCESEINAMHAMIAKEDDENEDSIEVIRDKAVNNIRIVAGTKYNDESIQKHVNRVINATMKKQQPIRLHEIVSKAAERLLRSKTDARSEYSPTKAEKSGQSASIDIDSVITSGADITNITTI